MTYRNVTTMTVYEIASNEKKLLNRMEARTGLMRVVTSLTAEKV